MTLCQTTGIAVLLVALHMVGTAAAQTNPRSVPVDPPGAGGGGSFGNGGGREDRESDRGNAGDSAGWQVCNRSGEPRIHVVAAWQESGRWRSSGWIPVDRGTCRAAPAIGARQAYYYATGKAQSWTGRHPFCLTPRNGRAVPGSSCGGDSQRVPFRNVTLGAGSIYTNLR